MHMPSILIHGGAGNTPSDRSTEDVMRQAVVSSYDMLKQGSMAVDAAHHAICIMEDSGIFNAGLGSYLTKDGTVEMDAGIMDGKTMQCGAVGALTDIKNPISVARKVMYDSEHSIIVGHGALRFALSKGFDRHETSPTAMRMKDFEEMTVQKYGTVGAVVMDTHGNLAAAVSTGGTWLKDAGRVGDSAIVGAGYYARNTTGAAVATGNGDVMLKSCITKSVCDMMSEFTARQAVNRAVLGLNDFDGGDGGVIAIDHTGSLSTSFNTKSMPVAYIYGSMRGEEFYG